MRFLNLKSIVCFLVLGFGLGINVDAAMAQGGPPLPGCKVDGGSVNTPCRAIIITEAGVDRLNIARDAGAGVTHNLSSLNAAGVIVARESTYWALANDARVSRVLPDRPMYAFGKGGTKGKPPKDEGGDTPPPQQVTPAGVARIGADQVIGVDGSNIHVAIVDTGLDYNHADLAGNIAGDCFTAIGDSCQDDNGHGTHVGGIVAAANNEIGVVGVAPGATLYSVKVLDSSGSGSETGVLAGLTWAIGKVDVVNMSLGGPGDCTDNTGNSDLWRERLAELKAAGIVVVVAAGNDSSKTVDQFTPAGCADVIAVASTTAKVGKSSCRVIPDGIPQDTASFFTTDGAFDVDSGTGVTVSAPGETQENNSCARVKSVGIESLALGGGTTAKSGTSMAAPHVAGVVALMLEADTGNTLNLDDVRRILRSTAFGDDGEGNSLPLDPVTSFEWDGDNEGVVDAVGAVDSATPPSE